MLEPPDLPNDVIVAALRDHYGISVSALTFLPIGHDPAAWVYRVEAVDGGACFLKVRAGAVNDAALIVPRSLQDRGVEQVVAPLPTASGDLRIEVGRFALVLYPFIDGVTGMDGGLTEAQWVSYGATLARVHAAVLPPDLTQILRREAFVPAGGDVARRLDAYLVGDAPADPIERELAGVWRARRTEILGLVERAETLGRQLRATDPPLVLCHADAHTANVLVDRSGRPWIVDWDEAVLAPRARDLMFVVGGGIRADLVGPREEGWFFRGYGPAAVDPLALAYYRHAWAVDDIGAYAEQALAKPDVGAKTRWAALRALRTLFEPGCIVDLAYAADSEDL